jgi:hypothetical protein
VAQEYPPAPVRASAEAAADECAAAWADGQRRFSRQAAKNAKFTRRSLQSEGGDNNGYPLRSSGPKTVLPSFAALRLGASTPFSFPDPLTNARI